MVSMPETETSNSSPAHLGRYRRSNSKRRTLSGSAAELTVSFTGEPGGPARVRNGVNRTHLHV